MQGRFRLQALPFIRASLLTPCAGPWGGSLGFLSPPQLTGASAHRQTEAREGGGFSSQAMLRGQHVLTLTVPILHVHFLMRPEAVPNAVAPQCRMSVTSHLRGKAQKTLRVIVCRRQGACRQLVAVARGCTSGSD